VAGLSQFADSGVAGKQQTAMSGRADGSCGLTGADPTSALKACGPTRRTLKPPHGAGALARHHWQRQRMPNSLTYI